MENNTVMHSQRGTWQTSGLEQLRRFLVLGVSGGNYYNCEKTLTIKNSESLQSLIDADGISVVSEIVNYAKSGRAPKKDPQLFALALCAVHKNANVRSAAYAALKEVCRIPTHLFGFVDYCEKLAENGTGWGRGRRSAIAKWYNNKPIGELIYHITKYKQRDGWSHRDLLRLAHVKPIDEEHNLVYKFLAKGELSYSDNQISNKRAFDKLLASDEVQRATGAKQVVRLINSYNLAHEHIPTEWLNTPEVWEALLPHMPLNALIRNLGKLTGLGLLAENSTNMRLVLEKLADTVQHKNAKIHPFNVLLALKQYSSGGEEGLGKLRWKPEKNITRALDELFYSSFKLVKPSDKRFFLGVDVSSSMGDKISGSPNLSCATGAAAVAMTILRTEKNCIIKAFSDRFVDLPISKDDSLQSILNKTKGMSFGSTDCALPMLDALKNKIPVDVFVVITDNESYSSTSPSKALAEYREKMGIDARLITIAMSSGWQTIADPDDKNTLNLVGFDSGLTEIVSEFAAGRF